MGLPCWRCPSTTRTQTTWFSEEHIEIWYAETIRWVPSDIITQGQMAVLLCRYEKKCGDGGFTGAWMYRLPFEDLDQISDWAFKAVARCNRKGIITGKGDNLFDPKGHAARVEMAAILMNYLKQQNQ